MHFGLQPRCQQGFKELVRISHFLYALLLSMLPLSALPILSCRLFLSYLTLCVFVGGKGVENYHKLATQDIWGCLLGTCMSTGCEGEQVVTCCLHDL